MKNLSLELITYVLPQELVSCFDLVEIKEFGETLHLYLDEQHVIPKQYATLPLSSNGFYEESFIKNSPCEIKK